MHDKVDIVYSLCLYRLDTEDVNDAVKVCIVLCTLVGTLLLSSVGTVLTPYEATELY